MKEIKKFFDYLIFAILTALPTFVFADDPSITPLPATSLSTLLGRVKNAILAIAGTIVVICLIIAGLLFATAGGDKEKVTKARQWLFNAILGVIVILLANSIIIIIQNIVASGNV